MTTTVTSQLGPSGLHSASQLWLLAALALPALGALLLLVTPAGWWQRWSSRVQPVTVAVGISTVTLAVTVLGTALGRPLSLSWVPSLGISFGVRSDALSGPLVVLTAAITWLCLVHLVRVRPVAGRPRALAGLILLVQTGLMGVFLATDLMQFFVFFEVALVPLWFMVAVWGSDVEETTPDGHQLITTAHRAATQFVCYTVVGSTLMLVGLLLVGLRAGTFDMALLTQRAANGWGLSTSTQLAALALIGTGLAIKVPIWPLHAWLPAAHTAAPTVGSVLLAAVMLKTGTYGLLRIAVPILPEAMVRVAPYLAGLAVAGIVIAALACLRQTDLKRMIAYGSVGHMGFVVLGISTLTPVGLTGAMLANIAHGIITGLLFFLVGALKDRYHTSALADLPRGLYGRLPRLGVLLAFAAFASLGLPGLAGFWGELFTLMGAYHPASVGSHTLPQGLFHVYLGVAVVGLVLTAAYLLRMVRQVVQGPSSGHPRHDSASTAGWVGELSGHELLVFAPLAVAALVLGLAPQLLTWLVSPWAQHLLEGVR